MSAVPPAGKSTFPYVLLIAALLMLSAAATTLHAETGDPIPAELSAEAPGSLRISVRQLILSPHFIAKDLRHTLPAEHNWDQAVAGDFDGDGSAELALFSASPLASVGQMLRLSKNETALDSLPWGIPPIEKPFAVLAGQFTPDHCADLLLAKNALGQFVLLKSNCRDAFTAEPSFAFGAPGKWDEYFRANINNDGLDDVVTWHMGRFEFHVGLLTSPGGFSKEWRIASFLAASLKGVTDSRGDGMQELLLLDQNDPRLLAYSFKLANRAPGYINLGDEYALAELQGGATFPKGSWETFLPGDYDGDGLGEILAFDPGKYGWWLARSNGRTYIEQALPALFPAASGHVTLFTEDFNGDGATDVLRCATPGKLCTLALEIPGPALAGIRFDIRAAEQNAVTLTGVTDQSGSAELALAPGKYTVNAISDGMNFTLPLRPLLIKSGESRALTFLAAGPRDETIVGQAVSFGSQETGAGPYICHGYLPDMHSAFSKWGPSRGNCPEGYAMFGVKEKGWTTTDIMGTCCRLPAADMITKEWVEVPASCPEGAIISGYYPTRAQCNHPNCLSRICRFINKERYQLGPETPGAYWGLGHSSRDQTNKLRKDQVPLALRYALGRQDLERWEIDGCLGQPAGGVLTGGAPDGLCRTFHFREFQYRGLPGDPPAGTPVKMLPECDSGIDPFNPLSGCRERTYGPPP